MSFSFSTISPQVAPTSLRDLSRRRELLDGAAALPVRLRIEPQADEFHLIHEDSGKILCRGTMEFMLRWVEHKPPGTHLAPKLRAVLEELTP